MTLEGLISLSPLDIYRARSRITGRVTHTPMVASARLARLSGARSVWLKLETVQPTGAFKLRGATNALLSMDVNKRSRGVVTASTGNHGRALAWAARAEGIPCTVCLSNLVPEHKVTAIRDVGADIVRVGNDQDAAVAEALRLAIDFGVNYIPPFDHPQVIAGQGTLGLEFLEDMPDLDILLVPLSGGGLIAGIALIAKAINPNITIIGVSPERGAAMITSLQQGSPVEVLEEPTLADSLGGGIGLDNQYTFPLVQALVDDVYQVSEDEIAAAMRDLYRHERIITEGAAAVGSAMLARGELFGKGKQIGTIITGNNVDMDLFTRIVSNL